MNLEALEARLQKIDAYFRSADETASEKERVFSRIVKLNEEVGELCEAALYERDAKERRKEKDIDFDAELADVIICALLLARGRQKEIWSEVDKKLKKQFERFNLE